MAEAQLQSWDLDRDSASRLRPLPAPWHFLLAGVCLVLSPALADWAGSQSLGE